MNDFNTANKTVHSVETQWHYKIMIAAGFTPITKEQTGFVRCYRYEKGEHIVDVSTGASSDYWNNATTKEGGYWSTLEEHVNGLK